MSTTTTRTQQDTSHLWAAVAVILFGLALILFADATDFGPVGPSTPDTPTGVTQVQPARELPPLEA